MARSVIAIFSSPVFFFPRNQRFPPVTVRSRARTEGGGKARGELRVLVDQVCRRAQVTVRPAVLRHLNMLSRAFRSSIVRAYS